MTVAFSGKDDLVQVQADIRNEIDRERLKRYQREKKKSVDLEEALRKLSTFSYTPVDYAAGLARKQFIAPTIPDYGYLLTEARLKAVNKYTSPIVLHIFCGLACVILSLALRESISPLFGAGGLLVCAVFLYQDLHNRQRGIVIALSQAKLQIEALVKEMRENIAISQRNFETAEDSRIGRLEKLLNGDSGTVFEQLLDVLQNLRLPFFLRCTVHFFKEPLIILNLPDRSIIPENTITISTAGNIVYDEKISSTINNQYSEVIAATAITIASLLYAAIPTLDNLAILGLYDKWADEEYHFSLNVNRDVLLEALKQRSGLEAFNTANAKYAVNPGGVYSQIEPVFPPWWDNTPLDKILSLKVNCRELF